MKPSVANWIAGAVLSCLVILAVGCQNGAASRERQTSSPEDVRREQLSTMSDEELERSGEDERESEPRPPADRNRGQRVIDQPRR